MHLTLPQCTSVHLTAPRCTTMHLGSVHEAPSSVRKWSKRYVIGLKSFAMERTIDLQLWTAGYQWARSNVKTEIIIQNHESLTVLVTATITSTSNPARHDAITFRSSIAQSEVMEFLNEEKKEALPQTGKRQINTKPNTKTNKRQKTNDVATASQSTQLTVKTKRSAVKSTVKSKKSQTQKSQTVTLPESQSESTATLPESESESTATLPKSQSESESAATLPESQSQSESTATATTATLPESAATLPESQSTVTLPESQSKSTVTLQESSQSSAPSAVSGFEKYKQNFLRWTVTVAKKPNSLNEGRCNCPAFLKEYMCKHIIGLSIRMKFVSAPAEAKSIPIGQKRKRGRPAKNKKALMIQ